MMKIIGGQEFDLLKVALNNNFNLIHSNDKKIIYLCLLKKSA